MTTSNDKTSMDALFFQTIQDFKLIKSFDKNSSEISKIANKVNELFNCLLQIKGTYFDQALMLSFSLVDWAFDNRIYSDEDKIHRQMQIISWACNQKIIDGDCKKFLKEHISLLKGNLYGDQLEELMYLEIML